jgi:ATP-dependent Lhr-like helicase
VFEADELRTIVTDEVGGSALFAARFRENAARALLMPRYNPGRRTPLWQQRQRSAQLLEVARKYPSFPIILETVREVLQDVYDLPALSELAQQIARREIRIVEAETQVPSPFARSMLFGYVAAFMYEGDSPLAERRAAALSLDPTLLAELLGRAELRELLDPAVIEQTEAELQRLAPDRRVRDDAEGVADLLRLLGPLSLDEIEERTLAVPGPDDGDAVDARGFEHGGASTGSATAALIRAGRAFRVTIAGDQRVAAIEDAARLRDALGAPIPVGVPVAFLEPVPDPLGDLVARYARTHGPFVPAELATRFGLGTAVATDALRRLAGERRVVEGEFRPGATGAEWCDAEVLRRLRARSLAALRHEVEPVDQATFARFLPSWQHVVPSGGRGRMHGVDGVVQVIEQLAGVPLPASAWESLILPSRVRDFSPVMLDELTLSGEVVWAGAGALPGGDGWVSLHLAESAAMTLPAPGTADLDPLETEIVGALGGGGAYFFRSLAAAVGSTDDGAMQTALWNLVWAGLVTNDTLAPLRANLGGKPRARTYRSRGRGARVQQSGPPTVAGRWSLVPVGSAEPTARAAANAEQLLDRYGVVTRGSVQSEEVRGGFATVYKVLSGFEDTGRARRGYFIEGLGAAQFATGATIDRLRGFVRADGAAAALEAVVLAAVDPANPYGAALPWPQREKHRPGRKAGALVVLVDGELAVFLEKGGKSALAFSEDPAVLAAASVALVETVRASTGRARVDRVDGEFAVGSPLGLALLEAGFQVYPDGLRLRA